MGAHTSYTPEIAESVLAWVASGKPLRQWCRENDVGKSTVHDWRHEFPEFAGRFARAKDEGFDEIAEESLELIDTAPERTLTQHGDKVDAGYVAWQKNRVEQRMKLLAKWDPKRYGDRTQHEHTGKLSLEALVAGSEPTE